MSTHKFKGMPQPHLFKAPFFQNCVRWSENYFMFRFCLLMSVNEVLICYDAISEHKNCNIAMVCKNL